MQLGTYFEEQHQKNHSSVTAAQDCQLAKKDYT